jgi:hypothetical protein
MKQPSWPYAPLISGVAGLGWVWSELAPQRAGFPDTDDPAVSLQFLAGNPSAHVVAGLWLMVASIALIATVVAIRRRLETDAPIADFLGIVGVVAAAMLFGMAVTRLSEGPMRYVQGLDQGWGEAAYLVTQFVGVHLFAVGGLLLLALWIAGTAGLGAVRGVVPPPLAWLALLPAARLLGIIGPLGLALHGMWLLVLLAIPAAFAWLAALGAWQLVRPVSPAARPAADPVPL